MRLDHLLSKEKSKGCISVGFSCKRGKYIERFCLVAMRAEATPVPIPNTTVKIRAADGTMLETAWESRRLPDIGMGEQAAARHYFIKHALHVMSIQEGIPEC